MSRVSGLWSTNANRLPRRRFERTSAERVFSPNEALPAPITTILVGRLISSPYKQPHDWRMTRWVGKTIFGSTVSPQIRRINTRTASNPTCSIGECTVVNGGGNVCGYGRAYKHGHG